MGVSIGMFYLTLQQLHSPCTVCHFQHCQEDGNLGVLTNKIMAELEFKTMLNATARRRALGAILRVRHSRLLCQRKVPLTKVGTLQSRSFPGVTYFVCGGVGPGLLSDKLWRRQLLRPCIPVRRGGGERTVDFAQLSLIIPFVRLILETVLH